MTTTAIQTDRDSREVVVSYAEEAVTHGAVYIEGIFTPAERVSGGASWDEVFSGFCDGADEAKERFGVDVRLTPGLPENSTWTPPSKPLDMPSSITIGGSLGSASVGQRMGTHRIHSSPPSAW